MATYRELVGKKIKKVTSDPSDSIDGQMWYNSTDKVVKGFKNDTDEDQKRFIQAKFKYGSEEIIVMNGYFPQGENRSHETKFPKKIKFYKDLKKHISEIRTKENKIWSY